MSKKDEAAPPAGDLPRVLVVAPVSAAGSLRTAIEAAGFLVRGVREPTDAPEVAAQWKADLVLVDAALDDPDPCELIARIRRRTACPILLLVSSTTGELVMLADRSGADDVVVAPLDATRLRGILSRAPRQHPNSRPGVKPVELPSLVIGASADMREVWRLVMIAARSSSSVIVTGETGVGKEVVARALHRFSARRCGPFVAVNCAALPETLLESELFGHEKGAFTGAAAQHKGRFELAHGGTLFLDEIGDLPLSLQVKLLRVLQERSFERVGGTTPVLVDVRIVAATHRDLTREVERARFRADLFYRLSVLSIRVPPLRDRKGDIPALWEAFIEEGAAREDRAAPRTTGEALRVLLRHEWPGNIRELHNVAQHALAVTAGDILPSDLPPSLIETNERRIDSRSLVGLTMREVERAAILENYEALGTVAATAAALGISTRKIHYRLREYREEGAMADRSRVSPGAEPPTVVSPRAKIRVLLAEDDDDLRWALADFLEAEGYEVVAVSDGRALLAHLGAAMLLEHRDVPPDIIVTDIRMPGLNGMQLLESVRSRGWATPVVLISAFGDDETRRRADALGATAFLDKPIDVAALQRLIDGAVSI